MKLSKAAAKASEGCLDCHREPDDPLKFPDGSKLSVAIDAKAYKASAHGAKLGCQDCHRSISDHPHPKVGARNARAYRVAASEMCKRCHYAYYTRSLDGIHFKQLASGNGKAPTCIDCHDAHRMRSPRKVRAEIPKRCASCHEKVSKVYALSVHGKALARASSAKDVPSCTDCHGAHRNLDPKTQGARAKVHELCGKCHSDKKRMKRYGLSANVYSTYLDDFHGRSNALYARGAGKAKKPMASCVSCHGVHDIRRFKEPGQKHALRARVLTVCKKCHEKATPNFADAWLSHYQPTLASAPLVWLVDWAYKLLVPFIISALVLHILLHLYRLRRRKSSVRRSS
ncbi:MAG: cytochrome c3 family protein [Myxococcales bacterium]|nr:cytochrome c3 family protein [Myxococcales bacterium]